jgi:hypothetical protein
MREGVLLLESWRGGFVELKKARFAGLLDHSIILASKTQARESSDIPRLNAFCLVAPTVRFRVLAMLAAGAFFFARLFKVRTFSVVQ